MRRTLERLERFARTDEVILLEGEQGVGKTRLGAYLHNCSPRRGRDFVHFDVAAVDDPLVASDLFGHARGAFTGAVRDRRGAFVMAHGGTLLLDEIGRASIALQQKLLRVIEYGQVTSIGGDRPLHIDVRTVLATNQSLEYLVSEERFLPDLYSRVEGFRLVVPPLRERIEDLEPLAKEIVARVGLRYGYRLGPTLHPELIEALKSEQWPGNIRQLDRALRRMVVEANGAAVLTPSDWHAIRKDFRLHADRGVTKRSRKAVFPSSERIRNAVQLLPKPSLNALARELGVARNTLRRHLPADVRALLEPQRDGRLATGSG